VRPVGFVIITPDRTISFTGAITTRFTGDLVSAFVFIKAFCAFDTVGVVFLVLVTTEISFCFNNFLVIGLVVAKCFG
jgi:hypothetical protein